MITVRAEIRLPASTLMANGRRSQVSAAASRAMRISAPNFCACA
jgi:hypothetical protein